MIIGQCFPKMCSLRASYQGCSATTSLEFYNLHRKSRCEMLTGESDITYDVLTLATCFTMFVYIRARFRFALISENLTAQSTGGTGQLEVEFKFQRRSLASSPSFSRPSARAPRRACSQVL